VKRINYCKIYSKLYNLRELRTVKRRFKGIDYNTSSFESLDIYHVFNENLAEEEFMVQITSATLVFVNIYCAIK